MGSDKTTLGRRITATDHASLESLKPGDYMLYHNESTGLDTWYAMPPREKCRSGFNLLAMLAHHDVTEHEDKTITVTPSILVTEYTGDSWHGYLEHGVWREV